MSYIIKFPIDGRDSYLCKVSGGYSLTTDIDKAILFKEEKAATNTLKSSLSKTFPYKNRGLVSYHEDKEIKEVPKVIKPSTYTKVDLEEFQKSFDGLSQQFRDIKGNKEYLGKKLSEVDKKIVDVEHYIELYTFNASDGYKLAKGLKDLLQERRKIKNQFRIIEALENSTCAEMMSGVASIKVNQAIKGDYDYTPRILKGMFEGKKKSS